MAICVVEARILTRESVMEKLLLLLRQLSEDHVLLEKFRADMPAVLAEYDLSTDDVLLIFKNDSQYLIEHFPADHLALFAVVTSETVKGIK